MTHKLVELAVILRLDNLIILSFCNFANNNRSREGALCKLFHVYTKLITLIRTQVYIANFPLLILYNILTSIPSIISAKSIYHTVFNQFSKFIVEFDFKHIKSTRRHASTWLIVNLIIIICSIPITLFDRLEIWEWNPGSQQALKLTM